MLSSIYTLAPLIILVIIIRLFFTGRRPKNYPPGPPTLPIIGNIHQLPARDAHLQFQKWAQEYGPVYSLILGSKTLVVLSSDQAVKDLLDKKSGVYSHRQDMYIGQTLCSGGLRILMMGYTAKWRAARKLVHGLLNVNISRSYVPYQMLENKQMLYELLQQPDDFVKHIRRYTNALTTTMVFGWRTPTYEDENMRQLFEGFAEFAEINQTGSAALIDFFPWLRKLPDFLLPTQQRAKELHTAEKDLYLRHWLKAKDDVRKGSIKPCFSADLVEAQKAQRFSDDEACYITGTLLEAGSDTTSSTLVGFIQAMLLFPDAQRKAQEELDRVVGPERMPTMEDEQSLPYIRCCTKESLRWMPTTILGAVPHATTQDDYYNGYLIPRNAGVMNNVWSINMDPERHPEPRRFNPDRYASDHLSLADSAANPDPSKRDHFTFGAGRRICPGMHVAERSLFLGIARMLWAFNIEPQTDAQRRPILPDPDKLTQGFVCLPEDFPAKITPRSKDRARIVVEEWNSAEKECLDPETKQWQQPPPMPDRKVKA
ncbi:putative cytochrome P450 oxidoreductase [Paraphoma chrysanthemicola]|uniref:Cytochrome P450 oxidoreductase n=1 Tax=Paraphoma chrysanthemicola TaxID=798071 RepID=A0A8K0RIN0_9PLEO|nr:putative cytochrome P450 oxidoreductase [Paraphoma chrysanthemicola]